MPTLEHRNNFIPFSGDILTPTGLGEAALEDQQQVEVLTNFGYLLKRFADQSRDVVDLYYSRYVPTVYDYAREIDDDFVGDRSKALTLPFFEVAYRVTSECCAGVRLINGPTEEEIEQKRKALTTGLIGVLGGMQGTVAQTIDWGPYIYTDSTEAFRSKSVKTLSGLSLVSVVLIKNTAQNISNLEFNWRSPFIYKTPDDQNPTRIDASIRHNIHINKNGYAFSDAEFSVRRLYWKKDDQGNMLLDKERQVEELFDQEYLPGVKNHYLVELARGTFFTCNQMEDAILKETNLSFLKPAA